MKNLLLFFILCVISIVLCNDKTNNFLGGHLEVNKGNNSLKPRLQWIPINGKSGKFYNEKMECYVMLYEWLFYG